MTLSPRSGFVLWLVLAGIGLALFFTGEYRDLPLPLGWVGMFLFVAAVWFSVTSAPTLTEDTPIRPSIGARMVAFSRFMRAVSRSARAASSEASA